jgi:putative PEP-CTERM system integral membrane protein
MKVLLAIFSHITFWVWNALFNAVVYFGILPFVGWPILTATALGQIPLDYTIGIVLLLLVPPICAAIGFKFFFNQAPNLLRLFFGVEVPLILICLVRLFLLRELTPASQLVVGTVAVAIAAFASSLFWGYNDRARPVAIAQLILHSLIGLIGSYAAAVLLFYAVPTGVVFVQGLFEFIKGFFSFQWISGFWSLLISSYGQALFFVPLSFLLFGFTMVLFAGTPLALVSLYLQSARRVVKSFASQYGRGQAIGILLATVLSWGLLLGTFNQQPQASALALLDKPATTVQAQNALLAQSEPIRQGLVNAYLMRYRYWSPIVENTHIQAMYAGMLQLEPKGLPAGLQGIYNQLLAPFLYDGVDGDDDKAAKRYAEFFDQPIQKAEGAAIEAALNATVNRSEAKAGLLDLRKETVRLGNQSITIAEHGDWADVELYERYENQTNDVQEVFYSFSLPENAVITGLWLGDTNDKTKRYPFKVSPRGAAQKVYNNQVQRVNPVDPALLEQVGPRHYRLRAFPIPVRVPDWVDRQRLTNPNRPTEMNLWLTYKVMRSGGGQDWALPQLGEKRNVFWNRSTQRQINGKSVGNTEVWYETEWLPRSIPAQSKDQAKPQIHKLNLGGQTITATPLSDRDYASPTNQRTAIVLDSSRSMELRRADLAQTFDWLKNQGFTDSNPDNNDADLFLVGPTSQIRIDDLSQFNPEAATFYGSIRLDQLLQGFAQQRGSTAYDSVLVLTDGDTYELSKDKAKIADPKLPLWMVHLGKLPPAYDDGVLKLLQNGGGVSTSIAEVLQRSATETKLGTNTRIADGYAWSIAAAPAGTATEAKDPFAPLAARQLIRSLSKNATSLEQLDAIHSIAKQQSIVTPYSSMIVLVNDDQRRQLAEAEASRDRFNRNVETGQETLSKPNNILGDTAATTPEPSSTAALICGGGLMFIWQRGSRFARRNLRREARKEREGVRD